MAAPITETHSRVGRRIACGHQGPSTVMHLSKVTCGDCKDITLLAEALGTVCGCRRPDVHLGVARAQHEIAGHLK